MARRLRPTPFPCGALLFLLFAAADPLPGAAPDPAEPAPVPAPADLALLPDFSGEWSLFEAAERDHLFTPALGVPNLGFSEAALWLRFSLDNRGGPARTLYVEVANPHLDAATLHVRTGDGPWTVSHTGDMVPLGQRPWRDRTLILPVAAPADAVVQAYLRVQSTGSVHVPLSIHTLEGLLAAHRAENFFYGLLHGGLLFLVLFNLFLHRRFADRALLHFAVLAVASLAFLLLYTGYAIVWLWPEHPELNQGLIPVAVFAVTAASTLLADSFLRLRERSPRLHRVMRWLLWGNLAALVASLFVPYELAVRAAPVGAVGVILVLAAAGLRSWQQGYGPALLFTCAWSLFLAGMVLGILRFAALVPMAPWSVYAVEFAVAGNVFVLALALGARLSLVKQENDRLQQAALEQQRGLAEERARQNLLLEQRVALRTEELTHAYGTLERLSEIGREITGTLRLDEILDTVYARVNEVLDANSFAVAVYDPDSEELVFRLMIESGEHMPEHRTRLANPRSFAAWCARERKEVVLNDVNKEYSRYLPVQSQNIGDSGDPQSLVYLPLEVEGRFLGVLSVQSFRRNAYGTRELDLLRSIAAFAAIALDNHATYAALDERNRQLLEGIRYAERIQSAVLPTADQLADQLPEAFVLFRPRAIVSGDFYWLHQTDGRVLVVVADCTGHGVPGALMSMLGVSLLSQTVKDFPEAPPGRLLEVLSGRLRAALRGDAAEQPTDGMDAAIVCLFPRERRLLYAGARRPLILCPPRQSGPAALIQPDRQTLGGRLRGAASDFATHELRPDPGTAIYLTTDGLADQDDGEGNKFGTPRLLALLGDLRELPAEEQARWISRALDTHRGSAPQRDDVTLLGFRA